MQKDGFLTINCYFQPEFLSLKNMNKLINHFLLLFIVLIILTNSSCKKEESGTRTWEMEMAEMESLLKNLERKGNDIDTTNMSVFYFNIKKGEGAFPKEGDSCFVSYIGFLPNGKKIEDSYDIHPPKGIWQFIYKPAHKVIGFTNGIGYMNKGSEIEMYITSDHAYGSKGSAIVPPYTSLVYRAKMVDLKTAE